MGTKLTNREMIDQINQIISKADSFEKKYKGELTSVHPKTYRSAANLSHYLALRNQEIRDLQNRLGEMGISRLGRAESHVLASLRAVRRILYRLEGIPDGQEERSLISFKKGKKQINKNTNQLLGKKLKGAATRILVTMPTEAAYNRGMVVDFLAAGMNAARINCAHDGPEVWLKIIDNIEYAKKKTGRNCRVTMDLGGPKIRTGMLDPGPKVIRLRPQRDLLGRIVQFPKVWLGEKDTASTKFTHTHLPVSQNWVSLLKKNDIVSFRDSRDKNCKLTIDSVSAEGAWATCNKSAYVTTDTLLVIQASGEKKNNVTPVLDLPSIQQAIILKAGDTLILTSDGKPGSPAEYDEDDTLIKPARISCTLPEVFKEVQEGETILFDDGKVKGKIKSVSDEELEIRITYAGGGAVRLRSDKGINLPKSKLSVKGLTEKDKEDLKFIVQHADIVNLSFVNSPNDVEDLLAELKMLGAKKIGIILKIETVHGYRSLPMILLKAMQYYPVGVMIARGDLAIETGWENLARIQEEIMWVCEAAHVPIVYATQVLENLAKKGMPSRAEITDVAIAERAECVMLNKGPYILDTIKILDEILHSMEEYQVKKAPMLPVLKMSVD